VAPNTVARLETASSKPERLPNSAPFGTWQASFRHNALRHDHDLHGSSSMIYILSSTYQTYRAAEIAMKVKLCLRTVALWLQISWGPPLFSSDWDLEDEHSLTRR